MPYQSGASGGYQALDQILAQRMLAKKLEEQQRQQQFDNSLQLRQETRADQTLKENTAYRQEQEKQRIATQQAQDQRAQIDDTRMAFSQMPRGTDVTANMGAIRTAGLGPMTEQQPPNLASKNLGMGAMQLPNDAQERTGRLYTQQAPAMPARMTKLPTPQELQQDETSAARDATAAETQRHNLKMEARPTGNNSSNDTGNAQSIADAIMTGDQPPVTTGLYRLAGPVRAALAKNGYNLSEAFSDWQATQKHIASLNSNQQNRMAQAVQTAYHSLDVIDDLAGKWKGGRFPILNKANIAIAKSGAYGQDVAMIAQQLEAQITDLTSELGNVYMGGNSPTDHALQLAGSNLNANWSEPVLKQMTKLARTNLQIRSNSMKNTPIAGASANNPYGPQQQAAGGAPAAGQPGRIVYDINGNPVSK